MTNAQQSTGRKNIWQLPIALVFIVAMISVVGGIEFSRERVRLEENLLLTTRAMLHSVDQELANATRFNQVLASTLERELMSRNFSAAQAKTMRALAASHLADHVVLSDESGQQLFNTLVDYGRPLPISSVRLKIKENQLVAWLWCDDFVGIWLQGA